MLSIANKHEASVAEVAFKRAAQEFEEAQRQVSALETEAVKALTGESQLDLKVVNSMLLKHRAKLDGATTAMEEAKARIEEEAKSRKANEIRVDELLTWAERFDKASYEAKHLVISQLVDRIEVRPNYEVDIHFRITAEQFLGKPITASA